ncbi:hypothetical protein ACFL6I_22035 [candidate division KSB1 bacterium]
MKNLFKEINNHWLDDLKSSNQNRSGFITLILLCVILLIITFLAGKIPFFWNMVRYSEIAHYYYENNFSNLIVPLEYDNGNPPFYGLYFTIIWKIFGKSLLISHLALYPFILGYLWQVYQLSKKFIPSHLISFAIILIAIEPTILTQSLLMGYDIILMFLFLFSVNQILNDKGKILLSLSLLLMTMLSIRGLIMLLSVSAIEVYLWKWGRQHTFKLLHLLAYFPALIFLVFWYTYRYYETGFLFSSFNNPDHREWVEFNMMIRNICYTGWKIIDFGRIGLILFIVSCFIWLKYRKIKFDSRFNTLLIISLIVLFFFSIINVPVSNPVSHPYFIILFVFMILVSIYLLQYLKWKRTIFIILILLMATGNFWMYPLRFGNGWDASLKVLPYFSLYEKMKAVILEEQIDPKLIGTKFPLYSDTKYTQLTTEQFSFQDLDKIPFDQCRYILHSNVINTFTPDEQRILNEDWQLIKSFQKGQVYLKLYSSKSYD